MKYICRILLSGLIIGILNNFVTATPSTQIWIPSTDVQAFLNPHFGWDSYIKVMGTEATVTNGGITMGVLPFKRIGLEIGIDYRDYGFMNNDNTGNTNLGGVAGHDYPVYFNAKLGVPEDAFFKYMPAAAIGAFDMGTKSSGVGLTSFNISYGLLAKNIWKLGRFSAGYYFGNDKALLVAKDQANGVLLSWDRTMTELTNKLWLAVDYQGGKNSYGALSFGAAWTFAPNVSVIVGYDIWNDSQNLKPTVTVQVDINAF